MPEEMKDKERAFNKLLIELASETYHEETSEDSPILKTLQSIDKTLKRIEIIFWKDIGNRSVFFDVPDLYLQMSAIGLVGSHAEQE